MYCTDVRINNKQTDCIKRVLLFILLCSFQNNPGIHACGYSGRKFILKKFYDIDEHGPSISYKEYQKEMDSQPKDYPV